MCLQDKTSLIVFFLNSSVSPMFGEVDTFGVMNYAIKGMGKYFGIMTMSLPCIVIVVCTSRRFILLEQNDCTKAQLVNIFVSQAL